MQSKEQLPKVRERGYIVVTAIFCVLLLTVAVGVVFFLYVTRLNYSISMVNSELAANGLYVQVQPMTPDFSLFNWAITAESGAFAIAAAAQSSKKKSNNNFQYVEEWMDRWLNDPEIRPFVVQVIQSWLMSNPVNT